MRENINGLIFRIVNRLKHPTKGPFNNQLTLFSTIFTTYLPMLMPRWRLSVRPTYLCWRLTCWRFNNIHFLSHMFSTFTLYSFIFEKCQLTSGSGTYLPMLTPRWRFWLEPTYLSERQLIIEWPLIVIFPERKIWMIQFHNEMDMISPWLLSWKCTCSYTICRVLWIALYCLDIFIFLWVAVVFCYERLFSCTYLSLYYEELYL